MNEQAANGKTEQDLCILLNEILGDLESALDIARNAPAKKLLRERIGRVRLAIVHAAAAEQELHARGVRRNEHLGSR